MLKSSIEKHLNDQVEREAYACFLYYSMASWMEANGFTGASKFLYSQGDEEMEHMKKIFFYINEAGGRAIMPSVKQPPKDFKSFSEVFEESLKSEQQVTEAIHEIVEACLKEKDYTTFNMMQWYVDEQHEEENQFNTILEKINLLGDGHEGLYLLDKELGEMAEEGADDQ